MNYPLIRAALSAILFTASACNPSPDIATPPKTDVLPLKLEGSTSGNGSDTNYGVPTAESVFSESTAPQPTPLTGRPSGAMTPAQEKSGMPIPGQNNDHSAPLAVGKPASSR